MLGLFPENELIPLWRQTLAKPSATIVAILDGFAATVGNLFGGEAEHGQAAEVYIVFVYMGVLTKQAGGQVHEKLAGVLQKCLGLTNGHELFIMDVVSMKDKVMIPFACLVLSTVECKTILLKGKKGNVWLGVRCDGGYIRLVHRVASLFGLFFQVVLNVLFLDGFQLLLVFQFLYLMPAVVQE